MAEHRVVSYYSQCYSRATSVYFELLPQITITTATHTTSCRTLTTRSPGAPLEPSKEDATTGALRCNNWGETKVA